MRAPKPLERTIQRDVRAYLARVGVTAVHVPNGSVLAGDRAQRGRQMSSLKRDGLSVGFPDLICFNRDGAVGFLEVKREGEKLGVNQAAWADLLTNWGQPWGVVRSVEDAKEMVREWGWL